MQDPEEITAALNDLSERISKHSLFVINDVLPAIERLKDAIEDMWISDDRFKELENAVADISIIVYRQQAKWPVDNRVKPRRALRRIARKNRGHAVRPD